MKECKKDTKMVQLLILIIGFCIKGLFKVMLNFVLLNVSEKVESRRQRDNKKSLKPPSYLQTAA